MLTAGMYVCWKQLLVVFFVAMKVELRLTVRTIAYRQIVSVVEHLEA